MMFRRVLSAIFLLTVVLLASNDAIAQNYPKGEVAVGWATLQDFDIDETFTVGFNAGAAFNVTRWLGIAGDFGYSTKSFDDEFTDLGLDLSVTTFAGGPRFNGRSKRVTGFGHVLFGAARFSGTLSGFGTSETESETEFLIQPGGGVDIGVSSSVAVRAQGDYLYVQDTDGEFRFVVGVVFRFGE